MKLEKREEYLAMVSDAVRRAEAKTPEFVTFLSQRRLRHGHTETYREELLGELKRVRNGNEMRARMRHSDIESLAQERLLSAIDAAYSGDFSLAMKEFSRLAAVAVRAMDWAYCQSVEHAVADKFRKVFGTNKETNK